MYDRDTNHMDNERLAYIMGKVEDKAERAGHCGSYTEGILELLQVRKATIVH